MNLWYVVMTRTKNIHYAVTPKDTKKADNAAGAQTALTAHPAAELLSPAYQQRMLLEAKNKADEIGIDPDAGREITLQEVLADALDQAELAASPDDEFDEDTLGYMAKQPGFRSMLNHLLDSPPEPPELRKYYASSYPDDDGESWLD